MAIVFDATQAALFSVICGVGLQGHRLQALSVTRQLDRATCHIALGIVRALFCQDGFAVPLMPPRILTDAG